MRCTWSLFLRFARFSLLNSCTVDAQRLEYEQKRSHMLLCGRDPRLPQTCPNMPESHMRRPMQFRNAALHRPRTTAGPAAAGTAPHSELQHWAGCGCTACRLQQWRHRHAAALLPAGPAAAQLAAFWGMVSSTQDVCSAVSPHACAATAAWLPKCFGLWDGYMVSWKTAYARSDGQDQAYDRSIGLLKLQIANSTACTSSDCR